MKHSMTPDTEAGHHVGPRTEDRTQRIARLLALDPEAFDWITAEAGALVRDELRAAVEAMYREAEQAAEVFTASKDWALVDKAHGREIALASVIALLGRKP
ncbi:MAG TPA: hypothetical protein VGQ64_01815 [Candidatus Limnocylindrales bacterium]|jgi:hypothetical protein|nr:hypothetical protein [Candidatus Limnocylindrales bacterium]